MSDVLKIVGVIALVAAIAWIRHDYEPYTLKRRIDGLEQRVVELERAAK